MANLTFVMKAKMTQIEHIRAAQQRRGDQHGKLSLCRRGLGRHSPSGCVHQDVRGAKCAVSLQPAFSTIDLDYEQELAEAQPEGSLIGAIVLIVGATIGAYDRRPEHLARAAGHPGAASDNRPRGIRAFQHRADWLLGPAPSGGSAHRRSEREGTNYSIHISFPTTLDLARLGDYNSSSVAMACARDSPLQLRGTLTRTLSRYNRRAKSEALMSGTTKC
eukprot:7697554-Pyramimonas_sp.AAC.2